MSKILLPVDGSANSLRALRHVVNRFLTNHELEVQLLHVRTPFSQHIARFVSRADRASYHREAADKALAPGRELLKRHGVPSIGAYSQPSSSFVESTDALGSSCTTTAE